MNRFVIVWLVLVLSLLAEAAPVLSFDSTSVKVDGKRTYLVSGEFHYFRVPQADWRRRMRLLKDVGGNCLATYVPWIVHEPEEGKIVFGDTPARDLDQFLRVAKEEGLMVIIRPGPYQYSELANSGLPTWLVEKYPEILLKKSGGSLVGKGSVDYNHPTFLAKARPYFREVAKVLKPHLAVNGGPIVLTQLDNELTGIHVWFGYQPSERYYADCAKYLETLKNWLVEDGITGPYCHNAGGAQMSASYKTCADRLGNKDFLLGYDHYYGLFQSDREAPVPYYFFDALFACDILRGWGYPPVGFEIQAGTIGNVPPILKEDLLAAWMCNLAAGMKGINYYVFTGGPNVPGTAGDPDMEMYDYQAPVGPDGTVRENYAALKTFGAFIKDHPELVAAERLASVRVGLEWQHAAHLAPFDEGFNRFGMFYALMLTDYSPEHFLLDREIPLDGKPLVLAGVSSMSAEAQRRVAAFVEKGGKLLVAPDFPRVDLAGKPCEILAAQFGRVGTPGRPLPFSVELMDKTWKTHFFAQADRVAAVLSKFGAKPVVRSTNRNVFATAFRLADGRIGVFALNLRSGAQKTRLELPSGATEDLSLAPMSVGYSLFANAATRAELLRAKFDSSDTNYVFVIAHRADWRHHPENSIAAIKGAIAMGADMVEIDVAKTKDGVFVLSHDGKLDRVSDKRGLIKDLTLAEVKSARLRTGQGGAKAALTDERVPTLVEALEVCRGKILVNIDKFYVDPNGITDIIQRLGIAQQVVLKGHGDYAWVKQSTGEPWKHVENRDFIYMPIVNSGKTPKELADVRAVCAQWDVAPYAPPAYEVCVPSEAPLTLFADFKASPRRPRLWINTLWDSLAHDHSESLTGADFTPDKVWGHWIDLGATMIQTDDPAALVDYLAGKHRHTLSTLGPARLFPMISAESCSLREVAR